MTDHCNNCPCETEAVKKYRTDGGIWFYLCHTCSEAFCLGQVNSEKSLFYLDADEESEYADADDGET